MIITIPAELWIMRTYHTQFDVPLGIAPGWWDDRKRNHKPVLPIYLRLDISNILSRALSCLRLSGHNFLVQRMRHNRNRRPYELRICDKCDWHSVQDEEHFLACHHSITDLGINAFLNQDSYRLLRFVSDLVSIFDTG